LGEHHIIEISCEHVIREISNYIDGEITPELRARVEEHIRGCKHCTAVLDGTANTLRLIADGRAFDDLFDLPPGFSERLRQRLAAHPESG
jgi:predicted anti-sigma-YlaC factor YlaD